MTNAILQSKLRLRLATGILASLCMVTGIGAAHAASTGGLDTPNGTTAMPFSIQGVQVMQLTAAGLGINGAVGINLAANAPTQALDVNGYVRIRAINGEGGTIQLDGANGVTMYVENLNGVFRLVNSPWSLQLFSVDQSGNVALNGNANITGLAGGVSVGGAVTGWYSDATNLAARLPAAGGNFYVQSSGGGATYMSSGPAGTTFPVGTVNVGGNEIVAGTFYVNNSSTTGDYIGINSNQIYNGNAQASTLFLNAWAAPGSFVEIGGYGTAQNLSIQKGAICLNGSCITAWPAGSSTTAIGSVGAAGSPGAAGSSGAAGSAGAAGANGAPGAPGAAATLPIAFQGACHAMSLTSTIVNSYSGVVQTLTNPYGINGLNGTYVTTPFDQNFGCSGGGVTYPYAQWQCQNGQWVQTGGSSGSCGGDGGGNGGDGGGSGSDSGGGGGDGGQ